MMHRNPAQDTSFEFPSALRHWRTRALNVLLAVVAVTAMPVIVFITVEAVCDPELWPATLVFLLIYLFIVGLALFRRFNPRLRLWTLLMLCYAAGVLAFARGGLAGEGRVYLLALPVIALILDGLRSGLIMAVLSLLTFAAFAATAHLGWMAGWLVRQDNTLLLQDWGSGGVAFAMTLAVLVSLQWSLSRFQEAIARGYIHLHEESERLRAFNENIVQSMEEGILLGDATGHITFVNPRTAQLLGYPPEELIGQHWRASVAPEYSAKVEEEAAKLRRGISVKHEAALLTREGQRVPIIIAARPQFDHGRFTGVLAVFTEIAERKRAEEALRESGERLRMVIQSMPVMLDALDADRNIIVWNQECERVTGYRAEEIVGNPRGLELLYPDTDYLQRVLTEWDERGDEFRNWELECTSKDGNVKTVAWSNISGRFAVPGWATWAVGIDVTERKRAEKALRDSEERYRSLFDRVPVGLYRTTPEGQVLDANPAVVEMLGYPDREALLATNAADGYVNPEDRQRWQALMEQKGIVRDYETQWCQRDGTVVWLRETGRAVRDDEQRVLCYEGILEDVTERRQMEKRMRQSERLAAMGYMAAALAHEVNNPLQTIRSNLELLLAFDLEPDEHRQRLDIALQQIERLVRITHHMLSFAQPAEDTRYPVSIANLVRKTLAPMDGQMQLAHIQVTTDLPTDLPRVFVAPDQIAQVLLNLTINAIQAMPGGGHLQVAARVDGDMVALSLTNDGPPLPPKHIEHLFDPFFTTKPDGTGLGLSISYSIIEQHGGTIDVENLEGGQGVVFIVTLPIACSTNEQETVP
jgi:two-component system, sporulation sensor kinase E